MYLYKCAMHYVLYYGNLYLLFDCNLHKAKNLIKNLSNLKSIKFFIVCMHTGYLSAASSVASVNNINYIILFL